VNYLQVDSEICTLKGGEGIVVMSSPNAWKKFRWCRKFFDGRPSSGYFIWVKKNGSIGTCVLLSKNIRQKLDNLIIFDQGVKGKVSSLCSFKKMGGGFHDSKGKIVLMNGAKVDYVHIHNWKKEKVSVDYEFILEKSSSLSYLMKTGSSPKKYKVNTKFKVMEKGKCDTTFVMNASNSKVFIKEEMLLSGEGSTGVLKLRIVSRNGASVMAESEIIGKDKVRGHLDCQGLVIGKNSEISLDPRLRVESEKSLLTHEASVGRIEEEEMYYLRSRGLSEKKAIDLLIRGFLGV